MVNIFANEITDLCPSLFLDCLMKNCDLKYTNGMALSDCLVMD